MNEAILKVMQTVEIESLTYPDMDNLALAEKLLDLGQEVCLTMMAHGHNIHEDVHQAAMLLCNAVLIAAPRLIQT